MSPTPLVVALSGLADEAAPDRTPDQQFMACAALGMRWVTLRFLRVGGDTPKNVIDLDEDELALVRQRLEVFDLRVSSIASPLGKIKLRDVDDGTSNRYVPARQYLDDDVARAVRAAEFVGTRFVRGFSFYPPAREPPQLFVAEAAQRLAEMAEPFHASGLTLGIEVEANLVGRSAELLTEVLARAAHPALALVFDGANLVVQGCDRNSVLSQFRRMKPDLGWVHVKDHVAVAADKRPSSEDRQPRTGEDARWGFVPAGLGESVYDEILADLAGDGRWFEQHTRRFCTELLLLELEPHLRQGGQFGGYSGPDGFGVALRHLVSMLDKGGIAHDLRRWDGPPVDRGARN